MKKLIPVLLALCLIAGLAACGSTPAAPATDVPATDVPATDAPATDVPATDTPATEEPAAEKTYVIGICQLVQHDALDAATAGFRDAVTAGLGADNVRFDEQNASGDSATCSTICTGFVAANVDLIMANATPALQAAVSATTTIPILGTSVTDYGAALNLDFDPAEGTGTNVSGSSDGVPGQLYADLVAELLPEAQKVNILYCSAEANSVIQADDFAACMEDMGVATEVFTFADSNDIQMVATAAAENCDAIYIPTDNAAASNMTIIRNITEAAGLPVICCETWRRFYSDFCGEENICANGVLATVSISYDDIGYASGQQAVEILANGADVGSLAIAYAQDPVKEYNAEYAENIGFEIPEGFVAIGG